MWVNFSGGVAYYECGFSSFWPPVRVNVITVDHVRFVHTNVKFSLNIIANYIL